MAKATKTRRPAPASAPTVAEQEALRRQLDESRQATRATAQARREARAAAERAARRRRTILSAAAGLIATALVAGGLFFWYSYTHPGESYPDQGNEHIASADAPHAPYNSDPPTSGPHLSSLMAWGVYTETMKSEEFVHNLEDAGVIISTAPTCRPPTVQKLADFVKSYDDNYINESFPNGQTERINQHVMLIPYKGLKDPVVLTAWTRMQRFQTIDEAGMRHFIDMYRGIDHHKGAQG